MRVFGMSLVLALAGTCPTLSQAQAVSPGNPLDQLPVPVTPPSVAPPVRLEVQTPQGAAAGKLDQTLTPTRFDIAGVRALPFDQIAQLFAPFAGKPVTVAQLVAAAREATLKYRAQGHPLSFVFLPDQDFAGGVVRVVAVEGYVASVRIEGDAGPAEPKLRAMAERLQAERPLTQAGFERVTQLIAQLPGLTVAADAAMPATTDGATPLVLKVKRVPYNLSVGADVRQPTSRAVLTGVWNDPFAPGSDLSASTLLGRYSREKLLTLAGSQRIGADGFALRSSFSYYSGYPDENLERGAPIERRNTNRRFELMGSYPLLLSARSSLALSGGFYAVDNADDYSVPSNGATLTEDTRVRALSLQLAWLDATPVRSRSASVLLAQGIDGLGASAENRSNVPGLSGPGTARLDFTRVAVDAAERHRFANLWGAAVSFGGQYSPHSLAASERISFGGPRFGRAYAAGDAAGDSGWGAGVELNRMFKLDARWLRQVEPYLLYEAAHVSNEVGPAVPNDLRSIALDMRLSDSRHYSLDLAVAKPDGDATFTNPQRKVRWSLMLSYQLAER